MDLSIALPRTATGKVYRACPQSSCVPGLFLLGATPERQAIAAEMEMLIRRAPGTPGITCCYCGTDAPDREFDYEGDVETVKDYVKWAAMEDVGDALSDMVRG